MSRASSLRVARPKAGSSARSAAKVRRLIGRRRSPLTGFRIFSFSSPNKNRANRPYLLRFLHRFRGRQVGLSALRSAMRAATRQRKPSLRGLYDLLALWFRGNAFRPFFPPFLALLAEEFQHFLLEALRTCLGCYNSRGQPPRRNANAETTVSTHGPAGEPLARPEPAQVKPGAEFAADPFKSDTSAPEQITLLRPRIESLENEVASLKTASRDSTAQIALLRSRLQSLEKEAASLKSISRAHAELIVSTGSEVFRLKHFSAEFDPAEPGKWVRVDTDAGSLLVSVKGVEPYLDGCKLRIDVGNPNSFTVRSFHVNATWTRRLGEDENRFDWFKSLKKKSFNLEKQLLAGKWSPVELILPDTDPTAVGYIEISLNVDTVAFGT